MAFRSQPPRYIGPCSFFLLEDTNAPQWATVYMQSERCRPYMYPDIDPASAYCIRTLYPQQVVVQFLDGDFQGTDQSSSDVLGRLGLLTERTISVDVTLEIFLRETFSHQHWLHPLAYVFSVNEIAWLLRDQTLDDILQQSYIHNTETPMAQVTVTMTINKRSFAARDILIHLPCWFTSEANRWQPDQVLREVRSLETFDRSDVQGQLEQWSDDPIYPIQKDILTDWPWGSSVYSYFLALVYHHGNVPFNASCASTDSCHSSFRSSIRSIGGVGNT